MSTGLHVERVRDLDGVLALEAEWKHLEEVSACWFPFYTWDWAVCWWRFLREDKLAIRDTLYIHTMRRANGELVGVAPMMLTERPGIGPWRMRHLQFLGADPNVTELRGLLARPDELTQSYQALLEHLKQRVSDWDWLQFSGVPAQPELQSLTNSHFESSDWNGELVNFYLELPATWEIFKGSLPRNIKESLRKCYNSPKRDGLQHTLRVVEAPADVHAAVEQFKRLHEARAKLEGTVKHRNVFDVPTTQNFLVEVCERFARRGALRIFMLSLGGQLAAARIGFVMGDSLYLYYSGFDPQFGKYSVMTTTVAEAIQYAIAQGFRTVNLSMGSDISKTRWNPQELTFREAFILSPTRRAELTHRLYSFARTHLQSGPARRLAKSVLARRAKR
jgi:CelD/BcsL family acetyltransferase involved in cellulose biosynthesis